MNICLDARTRKICGRSPRLRPLPFRLGSYTRPALRLLREKELAFEARGEELNRLIDEGLEGWPTDGKALVKKSSNGLRNEVRSSGRKESMKDFYVSAVAERELVELRDSWPREKQGGRRTG